MTRTRSQAIQVQKSNSNRFRLIQLGTASYQVKDFSHWDDIYTKASQSLKIEEAESGEVEITAEVEKEETKKSIYSGMFVTGGTMADERKAEKRKEKIKSEDDLFKRCAEADGRGARQAGKHSRYVKPNTSRESLRTLISNLISYLQPRSSR